MFSTTQAGLLLAMLDLPRDSPKQAVHMFSTSNRENIVKVEYKYKINKSSHTVTTGEFDLIRKSSKFNNVNRLQKAHESKKVI